MAKKIIGGALFNEDGRVADGETLDPTDAGITPQTAQADIATADASDLATAVALANATKTAHNALLAKLRSAGIIAS